MTTGRVTRGTGVGVTLLAAVGLAASLALAADKVRLLTDADFEPSCNFNPVLSCGTVMLTDQAGVFGFPNPFLGLIGFSVILTLGVLMAARVTVPTWVLGGAALGSVAGAVFVHWLIFQSLYRIGALCPWCMVVWAVTLPLALWFTLLALRHDDSRGFVETLWQWRFTVLTVWFLVIVVLIGIRFWDFWSRSF
ncbi:vitamin K epoxide reductase family protein [Nocardioides limicola]|uniref:vitamin K epoxide reductase family protein n=1 Tax=Nocardioides limicola TaxID=2803368 RepID=UPI00193B1081|nr:vitamin K epoxide reductase family protein [Nocardioides sp. DJM-14]